MSKEGRSTNSVTEKHQHRAPRWQNGGEQYLWHHHSVWTIVTYGEANISPQLVNYYKI